LYTTTMGGGGTGLIRRGSRLDKGSLLCLSLSAVAVVVSMQIGYHNQGHKDQHGENGRQGRQAGPGPPVGTPLVDDPIIVGGQCILLNQDGLGGCDGRKLRSISLAAASCHGRPDLLDVILQVGFSGYIAEAPRPNRLREEDQSGEGHQGRRPEQR
jgi:hypothetical protein